MKILTLLFFLIGCQIRVDSSAFGAVESNYRSLKLFGCLIEKPQSFGVCYGRDGGQVQEKLTIILPDSPTIVEVTCGSNTKQYEASEILEINLSDIYGDTWDLEKTCLMAIMTETRLDDRIVYMEADLMVYSYGQGFVPDAPSEQMAWECKVEYSTAGRSKVKCSNK